MDKKGLTSSLEKFEEECKRNGISINLSPNSSQQSLKGAKVKCSRCNYFM